MSYVLPVEIIKTVKKNEIIKYADENGYFSKYEIYFLKEFFLKLNNQN